MSSRRWWLFLAAFFLISCFLCLCLVASIPFGLQLAKRFSWEIPILSTVIPSGPTPTPTWEEEVAREPGVFRLPGGDPITFDPALAGDSTSHQYILLIFSGLVALDEELEVVPDIAQDWEVSPDGRTYTFHLREDVRFQEGRSVRAQDFKYSLERACDPATGSTTASLYLGDIVGAKDKLEGRAEEIRGVKVVDDHTLAITIDAPKAYFLAKLTYPTAFVVDRANVEEGEGWSQEPNGTGPFRLVERTEEGIFLARNDLYYQGPVALEGVEFILTGSFMNMYERGELDLVGVGPADIERARDPQGPFHGELVVVPTLDTTYVGFNVNQPPFDDPLVRQAFAYATNKKALVDALFYRSVVEAEGILPPGMPGYNPHLEGIPFDPQKAKELLEASTYEGARGLLPITLSGSGGMAEVIARMYEDLLGVDIEAEQLEWDYLLEDLEEGRLQMFVLGWVADYPDPENFLDLQFHSQSEGNNTGYSDPEVDRLLEEARVERDEERRMELYRGVEEAIVRDAPWIPLFHGIDYLLVKPYVKGLVVSSQGVLLLKDVYLEGR